MSDTDTRSSVPVSSHGVINRLRASLSQWRFTNALSDFGSGQGGFATLNVVPPDLWPGDATAGTELVQGLLHFGGQMVRIDRPDWAPPGASPGFLRTLHSFNWLHDLRSLGGDVARRQARLMVRSWIEQHMTWSPLAWDPPVLGRRIASWMGLHDFFCATADDEFRALVHASLRLQARHLARTINTTPPGHRRFAALKGLFYAGICLPKGEPRLALALRLLGPELQAQILADGGHAERNPMALLDTLRHLIDIRAVLRAGAQEVPERLQHAIDRMTPALRFFRHADGGLCLFNGGREGPAPLIETTLHLAEAKGKPLRSMPHSGFERLTAGRTSVTIDCGDPPRAGFDHSCHAGPLAFELCVGRDRMVVNCGAHPSFFPAWRRALGATAAHSTLTLNDTNAFELSETGLARRPRLVNCERQEENGAIWVECSHDGYEPAFGILHFRRIYLSDGGDDVRGEDTLEGPAESTFAVRFHLHPGVQASLIQQGQAVLLALPSGGGWRFRGSGGTLSLEESLYCGRGDDCRSTLQIVLTGTTQPDQTTIKWAFQREKRPGAPEAG